MTKKQAQAIIDAARGSKFVLSTENGNKGYYIRNIGPAMSFKAAKTWRQAVAWLTEENQ